jgi:RNA polymerase sigma-32 factor
MGDCLMSVKFDPILTRLINAANRYPILSFEREQEIAFAWRTQGDRAALEELVNSHLRLVVKIARGFANYGLPIGELASEGNVGLMQAAAKFDPGRGFRFSTYAMWWVRAAMQEYIIRSWSLVKIGTTTGQKKLFFNLRRLKAKLHAFDTGDMAPETVTAIAVELDVSESEVVEMNWRLSGTDSSLQTTRGDDDDGEWIDMVADDQPTQEAVVIDLEEARRRHGLLRAALVKLSPREREILVERHLKDEPATLAELSERYAVSRERIRQIEVRAVEKLQRTINDKPGSAFARSA